MSGSLPAVSILGIGAVTPSGRNLDAIARSISSAPAQIPAAATPASPFPEGKPRGDACVAATGCECDPPLPTDRERGPENVRAIRVNDTDLALDPAMSAQLRRADRFTKMAVAAACDAWNSARESCKDIPPERIGLFLCSGFGPHCRGFKFLDGIIDSGDTASSPTDFSHSVHGAASAYISRLLDLRGPSLNTTDFEIGFEEAVRVAQCWLAEDACDRVLIGAVEELGAVFLSCAARMIPDSEGIHPSEGAAFFMLARADVPGIARLDATASPKSVDLMVCEHPAVMAETSIVSSDISAKFGVTFTNLLGHTASASAFNVLGGLLLMRSDATIDTAATLRTSSEGRCVTLLLEK